MLQPRSYLPCSLKDLLDHVHIAGTGLVLDGVGLVWRRHLLGGVFCDIVINGGLEAGKYKSCGPDT